MHLAGFSCLSLALFMWFQMDSVRFMRISYVLGAFSWIQVHLAGFSWFQKDLVKELYKKIPYGMVSKYGKYGKYGK